MNSDMPRCRGSAPTSVFASTARQLPYARVRDPHLRAVAARSHRRPAVAVVRMAWRSVPQSGSVSASPPRSSAGREPRQELRPLLVGAVAADELGHHQVRVDHPGERHPRPRDRLDDPHVRRRREPEAAVLLRDRRAEEAELAHLLDHLVRVARRRARARGPAVAPRRPTRPRGSRAWRLRRWWPRGPPVRRLPAHSTCGTVRLPSRRTPANAGGSKLLVRGLAQPSQLERVNLHGPRRMAAVAGWTRDASARHRRGCVRSRSSIHQSTAGLTPFTPPTTRERPCPRSAAAHSQR